MKTLRKGSIIFMIGMIINGCENKSAVPVLDKTIPDYTFRKVLNSEEESISLRDLRGKVVILEFWATWCGPCIPAMRKLDSLQVEFRDEVEVITISSEDEGRLKKFIETTGTKLRVVSDSLHEASFNYQIVPHAIIIDQEGIVRAITNPKNITRDVLARFIREDLISLKVKDDFARDPELEIATIALEENTGYRIELRSYDQDQRGGFKPSKTIDGSVNGIEIWNSPIPRLYQTLFDVASPNRIVFLDSLSYADFPYEKEFKYNMDIEVSKELEREWRQLGIQFLNKHLDVNARMNTRPMPCFVLKDVAGTMQPSTEKEDQYTFMGPILKAKKIGMSRLTEYLENFTELPVVNLTNLEETYDIELNWQLQEPSTLFSELEKYGLKMERSEEELPVEVMEIYQKELDSRSL